MNLKLFKSDLLTSQRGTSTVIFAMVFTVLAIGAALTADIGVVMAEKSRLSSAADSAALAGAQELIANSSNIENVVNNYLQKNDSSLTETSVKVETSNRSVEVSTAKRVDYYFARIMGKENQMIYAGARARIENISSLKGTRPLAVIQQNFIYGKQYTLKEGAGDGTSGNYAAIALGGTGSYNYKSNFLNGYGASISVNDLIQTETGNMSGNTELAINNLISSCTHTPKCTYLSYNRTCPRIILIPVVNTLDISGRKYVKVLGFATFFLEGVLNNGGQADVTGRFITYNAQGEMSSSANDYGTYGIRLVK